ncbi:hypothetical protein Patl1_30299 [Pistacia atlantica]|uniref:Uncharacterized protein n=1 Tax=Pistacia atlantica TaxID=434234 RepID=A0ACC1AG51_9ROSI|nr:hypothetical protein Patl1_30299 [Pistacia atlantica]
MQLLGFCIRRELMKRAVSLFLVREQQIRWSFKTEKNATTPSMISKLPYSDEVACGGYTRVL